MENNKNLPIAVRTAVWNTYIGHDVAIGKCYVGCNENISKTNYECGHIKSRKNKGSDKINNLRPICSTCNKSMKTQNMDEFIDKYGFKEISIIDSNNKTNELIKKECNNRIPKEDNDMNEQINFISKPEKIYVKERCVICDKMSIDIERLNCPTTQSHYGHSRCINGINYPLGYNCPVCTTCNICYKTIGHQNAYEFCCDVYYHKICLDEHVKKKGMMCKKCGKSH